MARRGRPLGQQLHELLVKVGSFYSQRENFRLTPDVKAKFTEKLGQNPRDFFGRKATEVVRTDGLKLTVRTVRGYATALPAPSRWSGCIARLVATKD